MRDDEERSTTQENEEMKKPYDLVLQTASARFSFRVMSSNPKQILDVIDGRARNHKTLSIAEHKIGGTEDVRINAWNLVAYWLQEPDNE